MNTHTAFSFIMSFIHALLGTRAHSPGARRKRSLCTDALANLLSERRKRGVAVHARRARPGKLNARFAKPGTQVRFQLFT